MIRVDVKSARAEKIIKLLFILDDDFKEMLLYYSGLRQGWIISRPGIVVLHTWRFTNCAIAL